MSGECHLHEGRFFDPERRQWGYEVYCSNEAPHSCGGERELFRVLDSVVVTVEPREIAALLRDLPSIRDGFESDEAREAWLARKRDLLARIEADEFEVNDRLGPIGEQTTVTERADNEL